jgi:TolB-like protein/DNA-binding winged helix-turn-helix (wHTH) protein
MAEHSHAPIPVRFGQFEFDCHTGELRRRGLEVKLAGQPLQILAMLLDQPGHVISREEIKRRLWPADTYVEFDQSLNAAVKRLREVLRESADNPRFFETVPRRGYRFIAPLEKQSTGPATDQPASTLPAKTSAWRHRAVLPGVSAVVVICAALVPMLRVNGLRDSTGRKIVSARIESLAVLPFEDLSRDVREGSFADGITDEVITNLVKVGAPRVLSRTSVMHYKGTNQLLADIVRKLNVDAIVEGTVLRSDGRVRITAQLVATHPERHLWADSYERDLRDVLTWQREVARDVAERVRAALGAQAQPARVRPSLEQ